MDEQKLKLEAENKKITITWSDKQAYVFVRGPRGKFLTSLRLVSYDIGSIIIWLETFNKMPESEAIQLGNTLQSVLGHTLALQRLNMWYKLAPTIIPPLKFVKSKWEGK